MACRHIKTSGLRCESPALRGAQFCYYHAKTHAANPYLNFGPVQLPAPEDSVAIQLSVARINDAILTGRIDLKKAACLFNGLRIASHFIESTRPFDQAETVQSAEPDGDGVDLAPPNYVCGDEEKCESCLYSELCPRCIHSDAAEISSEKEEHDGR